MRMPVAFTGMVELGACNATRWKQGIFEYIPQLHRRIVGTRIQKLKTIYHENTKVQKHEKAIKIIVLF